MSFTCCGASVPQIAVNGARGECLCRDYNANVPSVSRNTDMLCPLLQDNRSVNQECCARILEFRLFGENTSSRGASLSGILQYRSNSFKGLCGRSQISRLVLTSLQQFSAFDLVGIGRPPPLPCFAISEGSRCLHGLAGLCYTSINPNLLYRADWYILQADERFFKYAGERHRR